MSSDPRLRGPTNAGHLVLGADDAINHAESIGGRGLSLSKDRDDFKRIVGCGIAHAADNDSFGYRMSIAKTIEPAIAQPIKLNPMKTMGDRVAQRLKEIDESQHWLAKRVGVKQPTINVLIKGGAAGTKYNLEVARALGVHPQWLKDGTGPKLLTRSREALLVGKVGAGAEIIRFPEGTVMEGVEPPPGVEACNAAIIYGESQYPLQDGWIVFYGAEHQGISEKCIGKLCVLEVKEGPTLLKTLKRGTRKGLYRLESWNAPPREDVKVEWASLVVGIKTI